MRRCVLLSGGFDSLAVFFKSRVDTFNTDYVFFDYGQKYVENERAEVIEFCNQMGITFLDETLPGFHDMPCRNFHFIAWAKLKGYGEVVLGTRNPLPLWDKYGDANWLALKLVGHVYGIKISMPLMLWTKKKVFKYLKKCGCSFGYNCYNNNTDFKTCSCVNCVERRKYEK